jgi:hypothetical protein
VKRGVLIGLLVALAALASLTAVGGGEATATGSIIQALVEDF